MSGSTRRRTAAATLASGLLVATAALTPSVTAAPASSESSAAQARPIRGGEVTIKRDSYGIPHVYANTTYDLFRGYGYSVAQDRLFQMEMSRRSTQGTVSEVLGSAYLALDKDTRVGMNPDSIKRQVAALSAEDRDILQGYADGMNAYLEKVQADPAKLMPKQFNDFGFSPTPWTAYDVAMVWVGTMANRYSDSSSEIANYQLLQSLIAQHGAEKGRVLFDELQWQEDTSAPTTVPRGDSSQPAPRPHGNKLKPVTPGLRDVGQRMMRRAGADGSANSHPEASNIWITGKARSKGAKSILINGPQFQWFNPSYVYGIGLHGAGWDFSGNTPFAYPSVIFGTNGRISWGATAGPLNLVDVYQETLNPDNPRQYRFDGQWRDMQVRHDKIAVKGEPDVDFDVLRTVHGPVTSVDAANGTAYSKRRSWEGAEVQSLISWAKVPKARSFKQVKALAADFATTINWYYADKSGNIGYISPGRLPIRPDNQDMRVPAKGDGSMEWEGFAPASANPTTYNPKQGFIANWNNQSGPGFNNDYGNWSYVDRAQEIFAAFTSGQRKFTADDMWQLNKKMSYADLNIRYLRKPLAAAVADLDPADPVRVAAEQLIEWDGQTRDEDGDGFYDGPQPALMRAWLPTLFHAVLDDDLPPAAVKSYSEGAYEHPNEQRSLRPFAALKLMHATLADPDAPRPAYDLFNGADPLSVLRSTLGDTVAAMESGQVQKTTPVARHLYSSRNFLGVPQAGADEDLVGPVYMNRGTQNDLAVLGKGVERLCIAAPPGQSGFISPDGVRSPHYDDQLDLYANFDCREEKLSRRQVNADTESVTVLPARRHR